MEVEKADKNPLPETPDRGQIMTMREDDQAAGKNTPPHPREEHVADRGKILKHQSNGDHVEEDVPESGLGENESSSMIAEQQETEEPNDGITSGKVTDEQEIKEGTKKKTTPSEQEEDGLANLPFKSLEASAGTEQIPGSSDGLANDMIHSPTPASKDVTGDVKENVESIQTESQTQPPKETTFDSSEREMENGDHVQTETTQLEAMDVSSEEELAGPEESEKNENKNVQALDGTLEIEHVEHLQTESQTQTQLQAMDVSSEKEIAGPKKSESSAKENLQPFDGNKEIENDEQTEPQTQTQPEAMDVSSEKEVAGPKESESSEKENVQALDGNKEIENDELLQTEPQTQTQLEAMDVRSEKEIAGPKESESSEKENVQPLDGNKEIENDEHLQTEPQTQTQVEAMDVSSENEIAGPKESESSEKENVQALEGNQQESETSKESTRDGNENEDSDDDVVVISETPRDNNKKISLATVYKCVRCGHTCKSKVDLNKHLLQDHKLIIVSKQKSVDCLFCAQKLDMKEFHQHLKSEHKVLLVKSKGPNSTSDESASTPLVKEKSDSSCKLIDLTSDDESNTPNGSKTKSSAKPSGKTIFQKSSSNKSLPPEVPVRKSPRVVKPRKYAEDESASSGPEDADTFVDDDDDDYDPITEDTNKKTTQPVKPGAATLLKSSISGVKPVRLSFGQKGNSNALTSAGNVISASALNSLPSARKQAPVTNPSTTMNSSSLNLQALKNVKANQTIRFNGQLYNVTESGGIKYLIPVSVTTPIMQVNRPNVSTVTSPLTMPAPVSQVQNIPSVSGASRLILPSSSGPLVPVPQGNAIPTSVAQQPIVLSSPSLRPGQTLLLTLPQGMIQVSQGANNTILQQTVPQVLQSVLQPQTMQTIIRPRIQSGVQNLPPPVVGAAVQPGNRSTPVLTASSAFLIQQNMTQSQASSNVLSTSVKAVSAASPLIMKTGQTPATTATTFHNQRINIATPQNSSSSNLHKSGGLFALEVCLDTDIQPGTEPKLEPKITYMVQEKETVFEETQEKKEETVPEEPEKLDSEKSKAVVAAAIARGHITLNDLSSLSEKVLFECPKCNKCFPQPLLLCLHTKRCSKQAPSSAPEIKVHSTAAVVSKFFNDPIGGRGQLFVCCRFCRARIINSGDSHSSELQHLSKHIEPKVKVSILPSTKAGKENIISGCTPKALEWVDYIVPPFTLENPPTSSKTGQLDQYVTTHNVQVSYASTKKKKKKKKKKNKHKGFSSDDDLVGSRLSSLRAKTAPYLGSARPIDPSLRDIVTSRNGNGSAYNMRSNRNHGGRAMMGTFKHITSPNKRGSTLTAYIPIKAKHQNKGRQGESGRQTRTRSDHVHWRRQSRRFAAIRDRDTSTPDNSTPDGSVGDVIQISSDEDEKHKGNMFETNVGEENSSQSNDQYTVTEDDISDYLKLLGDNFAEELQISPKAPKLISPSKENNSTDTPSDLVDYYGNDADSTLGCEPLIMEPEQVVCYFKSSSHNKMKCQFRDCEVEVTKNIRIMLSHIRVHFQILVPLQLLTKLSSQYPRQSIPRPLRLTFSQVEAHFTIADMQEANLHLGEVQHLYTCMWKNCNRSRCYKKNILQHLLKHIFFTLISKDEYQAMSKTMTAYSTPSQENTIKKLRIVAMNKNGEKIALVISIPASQANSPDSIKAAIEKNLASERSVKLPSNVLNAIVAKFASSSPANVEQAKLDQTANQDGSNKTEEGEGSANFLTEAELISLQKRFPFIVEKLNLTIPQLTNEQDGGEIPELTPGRMSVAQSTHMPRKTSSQKLLKIACPKWRTLRRRSVKMWNVYSRIKSGIIQTVKSQTTKSSKLHVAKRRASDDDQVEQPPNKKEKPIDDSSEHETNPDIHVSSQEEGTSSDAAAKGKVDEPVETKLDAPVSEMHTEEMGPDEVEDKASSQDASEPEDTASTQNASESVESEPPKSLDSNVQEGQSQDPEDSVKSTEVLKINDNRDSEDTKAKSEELVDDATEDLKEGDSEEQHPNGEDGSEMVDHDAAEVHATSSDTGESTNLSNEPPKLDGDARTKSNNHKTLLVFGLAASRIVKAFKFNRCQKKERVKIAGRGHGVGVFKCKKEHCTFFQEAMSKDKKIAILEALALHMTLHMKTRHRRGLVFYPNPKTKSIPASKFLELFKDQSPTQDMKKIGLKDKFQQISTRRSRIAGIRGRIVCVKVQRLLKCISSGCLFGSFDPSRSILESHLRAHLYHAQRKTAITDEDLHPERTTDDVLRAQQAVDCDIQAETAETCLPGTPSDEAMDAEPHVSESAIAHSLDIDSLLSDGPSLLDKELPSSPDKGDDVLDGGVVAGAEQQSPGSPPAEQMVAEEAQGNLSQGEPEADEPMDTSQDGSLEEPSSELPSPTPDDAPPNPDGDGASPKSATHDASLELETRDAPPSSIVGDASPRPKETAEEVGQELVPDKEDPHEHGDNSDGMQVHEESTVEELDPDKVVQRAQTCGGMENTEEAEEKMEVEDSDALLSDQVARSPDATVPSKNMDDLAARPGDAIDMFYDDLQAYFTCYTKKMSQTREFGRNYFSCPKCGKRDLGGDNLPKHLELHVGKEVSVISVDGIKADLPECGLSNRDITREPVEKGVSSSGDAANDLLNAQRSSSTDQGLDDPANSSSIEDSCNDEAHDTIYLSEEEMVKQFFTKKININSESQVPFGREILICRTCPFQTMTIMDTSAHVELHLKKSVVLRK